MKYAPEPLGLCVVVTLIATGLWYLPELDPSNSHFLSGEKGAEALNASSTSSGNEVVWSKDGEKLLVRYRGGSDFQSQLALLDLSGGMTRVPFDSCGADTANAAALFVDGRHALIGTPSGRLWRIDLLGEEDCQLFVDLQRECAVSSVAVAEDGTLVAGGMANGRIYVVTADPALGNEIIVLRAGESQSAIGHLQFSQDGEQLLAARNDGQLDLWHVPSKCLLRNFKGHPDVANGAEFLGDGRRIISAGLDDTIRIWDVETGRELWRGDFGQEGLHALDVSRDGRFAAWGGNTRRIVVWDLELGARRMHIDSPLPTVYYLSFSDDGTKLAAVGRGVSVHLFDTRTGQEITRLSFESRRL